MVRMDGMKWGARSALLSIGVDRQCAQSPAVPRPVAAEPAAQVGCQVETSSGMAQVPAGHACPAAQHQVAADWCLAHAWPVERRVRPAQPPEPMHRLARAASAFAASQFGDAPEVLGPAAAPPFSLSLPPA